MHATKPCHGCDSAFDGSSRVLSCVLKRLRVCNACFVQAEGTPYGTPYSSVGGFSSLQSTPHSLTGYSPLTHFHGSLGSSHLGTPARSMPSASLQVTPSM